MPNLSDIQTLAAVPPAALKPSQWQYKEHQGAWDELARVSDRLGIPPGPKLFNLSALNAIIALRQDLVTLMDSGPVPPAPAALMKSPTTLPHPVVPTPTATRPRPSPQTDGETILAQYNAIDPADGFARTTFYKKHSATIDAAVKNQRTDFTDSEIASRFAAIEDPAAKAGFYRRHAGPIERARVAAESPIIAEYQKITDPISKSEFYAANQKQIDAEFRRLNRSK